MNSAVAGAASFALDYGDGTTPVSATTLDALAQAAGTHTYNDNGMYKPVLTVMDGDGVEYSKTAVVNVSPPPNLTGKWDLMKAALTAGNVTKAAGYFSTATRDAYQQQFQIIHDAGILDAATAGMGEFRMTKQIGRSMYGDMIIVRDGTTYSYFILFVKDDDGIWRIRSF